MPLQHSHEEQPAPLRTVTPLEAPQENAVAPVSVVDAPRYDAAAVKQIIALAEQMQSHHRQTLSADEVEALGHEVGVEPQFIRRALLQVEFQEAAQGTKTKKTKAASHRIRRVKKSRRAPRAPLSRRQWMLMTVPPALYLLFALLTLNAVAMGHPFAVMLYLLVPAAIALFVGIQGQSRRVGGVGGGLFGLAMFLSIVLSAAFHGGGPITLGGEFFLVLGVMLGSGAMFGIVGDTIHRITSKEGGKRFRTSPLVKWKD